MTRGYATKDMKAGDETSSPALIPYFFPAHSITIHAVDKAEAERKLAEHVASLKEKK